MLRMLEFNLHLPLFGLHSKTIIIIKKWITIIKIIGLYTAHVEQVFANALRVSFQMLPLRVLG